MEKLSTRAAIEHVLRNRRKPLSVGEITELALPLTALEGKTPRQTFFSVAYTEA